MRQRVVWIVLTALAWLVLGTWARGVAEQAGALIQGSAEVYSDWLPTSLEIPVLLVSALGAYALMRVILAMRDAPRQAWIGVPMAELLMLAPGVIALVSLSLGHAWFPGGLVVDMNGNPSPIGVQAASFFVSPFLPALLASLGASFAVLRQRKSDSAPASA